MQRGAARSRSSAARPGSGRDTRARGAAVSARLLGRGHDSRCSAVRIHKWVDSKQNRHCCVPGDREGAGMRKQMRAVLQGVKKKSIPSAEKATDG